MKILVFIFLFFFSFILKAQSLTGVYRDQYNGYLNCLNDSIIIFDFPYGNGLLIDQKGCGKFKRINNNIIVNTFECDSFPNSHYEVLSNNSDDSLIIEVIDKSGVDIIGVNISFRNNENEIIDSKSIDKPLLIKNPNYYKDITISFIGYSSLTIPRDGLSGKYIKVFLSEGQILLNTQIKFEITFCDSTVCLFGPIFETSESRRNKIQSNWRIFLHWPWKWNFKRCSETTGRMFCKL